MLIFNHIFGHAWDCPQLSFHIAMDDHKDYMLVSSIGDETCAKPIWVARAFSQANFSTSHPHFKKIQVEKYRPTTQNEDVMCHYTSWHTNHKFC